MDSLYDSCTQLILGCTQQINGALVYLDAGAGEVVHSAVGAAVLFGAGALNVCDLERASPEDALLAEIHSRRVEVLAIFITELLPAAHPKIVKAVLAHRHVKACHIFSSVSEHAHACLGATGVEAYAEYSAALQQEVAELCVDQAGGGLTRVPPQVRVQHVPLHICPLGPTVFVLPAASSAAVLPVTDGRAAGWGPYQPQDDEDAAGATSHAGLSLLAHTLAGVVATIGNSMNIFHIGAVSQHIAQELASLPLPPSRGSEGQAGEHSVAVVLLDRSLDLVTPAAPSDHPLDAMMDRLPRSGVAPLPWNARPGGAVRWRPIDVRGDGAPCCPLSGGPGCPLMGVGVLRPADTRAQQWVDQLLNRRGKDAAAVLRKWLKEGLRQEGIAPPFRSKMGPVPPSELQALAEALAAQPAARQRQACAMALGFAGAQALGGNGAAAWEAAAGLSKQVLQARHSGMDMGQLLLDVLNGVVQGKGMVGLSEVLPLLAAAYSLSGDRQQSVAAIGPEDEVALKSKVVAALLLPGSQPLGTAGPLQEFSSRVREAHDAGRHSPSELQALRLEAEQLVESVFEQLHFLARCRRPLQALHTLGTGTPQDGTAVVPLLCQVVDQILAHQGGPDLAHATSQLRGLLSLGLGHLGLKAARPTPGDASTILLFVVGGISLAEVREVYQELTLHLGQRPRFLLAGTALITPADVADKLALPAAGATA